MAKQLERQGNSFREQLLTLLRTDEEVKAHVHALLIESEVLKELRAFREDANGRFESMGRRFETMDRRFEAMDRRFEVLTTELKELREDTNRRFEAVDKRFEAMDRRFEAVDKRFEEMIQEMRGTRRTLDMLGSRWGIQTEEAVRKFAQEFIASAFGVAAESWSYPGGQLDLIIRNGKHYLIEVKSTVNSQEVKKFSGHIAAYQEQTHIIPSRKIMVTAHATSDAFKEAVKQDIEIITG